MHRIQATDKFFSLNPVFISFSSSKGKNSYPGCQACSIPPSLSFSPFSCPAQRQQEPRLPSCSDPRSPQSSALSLAWNTNVFTAFAACSLYLPLPSVCLAFLSACQPGTARCRSREISKGTRVASSSLPWCEKE